MKQEPWPARAENPRPSGRGEVNLRIQPEGDCPVCGAPRVRKWGGQLLTCGDRGCAYELRARGNHSRDRACGTPGAYRRHIRRGEPLDDACRAAHAASERSRYQVRKAPLAAARRDEMLTRRRLAAAQEVAQRIEDYAWLRSWGEAPAEAARRTGIRDAGTIARYERAWQAQRQEAA